MPEFAPLLHEINTKMKIIEHLFITYNLNILFLINRKRNLIRDAIRVCLIRGLDLKDKRPLKMVVN